MVCQVFLVALVLLAGIYVEGNPLTTVGVASSTGHMATDEDMVTTGEMMTTEDMATTGDAAIAENTTTTGNMTTANSAIECQFRNETIGVNNFWLVCDCVQYFVYCSVDSISCTKDGVCLTEDEVGAREGSQGVSSEIDNGTVEQLGGQTA